MPFATIGKRLTGFGLSALVVGGCLLLAGVGGASAAPTPVECVRLTGLHIPASSIGLPTQGAVVTDAKMIAGGGAGAKALPDYCLVSANIVPVDHTAPNIGFRLALPTTWNSKVLMLGGGGFDGTIPDVAGDIRNTTADALTPLGRGYAVFASDSGHQAAPGQGQTDATFALNAEAFQNYMGDALKKTRDAALFLIKASYRREPIRSYFIGSSNGGREALVVAGRWPKDWDGAVSLYPAQNYTTLLLGHLVTSEYMAAPGAYLNRAKRGALHQAALAACDALDGANDGIISNVRGCNGVFDPTTAQLNGRPLRCPGGADTGDTCLSDTQLAALKKMNVATKFNFPLASGDHDFLGFNVLTADLGVASPLPREAVVAALALGNAPPAFPETAAMSLQASFSDGFVRYMVAAGPNFDYLTLDVSKPGPFAARISQLSASDLAERDLTGFINKGGKLLMMQGTDDLLVSPRETELYYQRLRTRLGAGSVDANVRFYEVPGFGHSISTVFNASWDQLTALENWVEKGVDPAHNQVVADSVTDSVSTGIPVGEDIGVSRRTRPLCLYPTWPKYLGSGDLNQADSFTCAAH